MAIYTVDAGGNGADYTSIQAALDAAAATGDTIRIVGGGPCVEALVIDKSVTIEGIRAGEAAGSTEARAGGETMISGVTWNVTAANVVRSEEHTSELQSLMRISYAVFCLKKKNK